MRFEHPRTPEEQDAFTGWRRVLYWHPGERKAVKRRSHRVDRLGARRNIRVILRED